MLPLRLILALSHGLVSAATMNDQPLKAPTSIQHCEPTATIEIGALHGTQTSLPSVTAPVNKFLGIPYAQTPPKRFAPPQPLTGSYSNKPLNVTAWKPACIQQFADPPQFAEFTKGIFNSPPPQESEDCLYINVYAPSTPAPQGGRAVLFWIFGGGLAFGTGSLVDYDGSAFAAYEDVIVVTFNYRTNAFGFPGSPQLPLAQSNPGYLDQQFALEWVQRNIGAFGGNKDKVTIFGESAGAASVDALITSYPKSGHTPFRAAILESGTTSYQSQPPVPDPYEPWNMLIDSLNCSKTGHAHDPLACARAAPAQTIKSIVEKASLVFDALPDNVTRAEFPALRRQSGNFAKVPVLGGTNAQEGRLFTVGQTNLTAYLLSEFGETAPQLIPRIKAAFPVGTQDGVDTGYDRIAEVYTLLNYQCRQALWAHASSLAGVPTWRFYYNASFPNTGYSKSSGAYHSSEINSVFSTYAGGPVNPQTEEPSGLRQTQLPPTAQQVALSNYMRGAWAAFARNPAAGPGWNKLGSFKGVDLGVLGTAGGSGVTLIREDVVDARCSLFEDQYRVANSGVPLPLSTS